MQPTETQVQRSLAALRSEPPALSIASSIDRSVVLGMPDGIELPVGLAERLSAVPPVRPDRLADARSRLEQSGLPEADDLARRLVGRLVCDRLR